MSSTKFTLLPRIKSNEDAIDLAIAIEAVEMIINEFYKVLPFDKDKYISRIYDILRKYNRTTNIDNIARFYRVYEIIQLIHEFASPDYFRIRIFELMVDGDYKSNSADFKRNLAIALDLKY